MIKGLERDDPWAAMASLASALAGAPALRAPPRPTASP
jgi:hypothetical protein